MRSWVVDVLDVRICQRIERPGFGSIGGFLVNAVFSVDVTFPGCFGQIIDLVCRIVYT